MDRRPSAGAPAGAALPHENTTTGGNVPQTQGWVARGWEEVRAAFDSNFERGAEVGAAFAAYQEGRKVVDLWGGIADERSGTPWSEETMVVVFSATKGVTAMCANRLADEGLLDVEAPVARYWPEFAKRGKESVTVADLLAHRAGLAWTEEPLAVEDLVAWDPVVKVLEAQAPSWPPGSAHGYHAGTFGWLVGEVLRRVSGRSVGTFLRDEITGPLDASLYIGLPESEEHRVARLVPFSFGESFGGAAASGVAGLGADSPTVKAFSSPRGRLRDELVEGTRRIHAAEIPAANAICDARSLALCYSACLGDVPTASGGTFRVMSSAQLDRAVVQQTKGPDVVLLGLDIQWGLGFMLGKGVLAQAGLGGPTSFGHIGLGGSIGWADPEIGLAMGYVMNKMSLGATGDPRGFRLMRTCVECARAR
jgi:CubicO group peptidase (beta-lactamase class C family)